MGTTMKITPRTVPNWKTVKFIPRALPSSYPPQLPLIDLYSAAVKRIETKAKHDGTNMLQDALDAPHLHEGLVRKDSRHSHLAFDGDIVISLILHAIGKKYTDHVYVRHQIVAHVGSNATLASVCLESGILDIAFSLATRNGKLTLVPTKVAADILEAVVAATYNLLGFSKTLDWFEEIARPWVEEVVRKLNF